MLEITQSRHTEYNFTWKQETVKYEVFSF